MAKSRQIEFAPVGYEWRSAGQDGQSARHALDPKGNVISLRQAQNIQAAERARLGQPKAPQQRRAGKINTRRNFDTESKSATTIHNAGVHGRIERLDFYTLDDARNWVTLNGIPKWAANAIIQIRYTERLRGTGKKGSGKVGDRNGYASISGFSVRETFVKEAGDRTFAVTSDTGNIWNNAESRIADYDVGGDNARVYIYLQEK